MRGNINNGTSAIITLRMNVDCFITLKIKGSHNGKANVKMAVADVIVIPIRYEGTRLKTLGVGQEDLKNMTSCIQI